MATLLPEGKQSFTDAAGKPLVGGKVYTYDAGTSSPRPTYQDAAGTVPNTNPVVLDARGETTVFWSGAYKVVLKDASDNTIWSVDDVFDEGSSLRSDLAATGGAALVGFIQVGAGAIMRSIMDKVRERVSVEDFGAVGDGRDSTLAVQNAIDTMSAAGGGVVELGHGNFSIGVITPKSNVTLIGKGSATTITVQQPAPGAQTGFYLNGGKLENFHVRTMKIDGNRVADSANPQNNIFYLRTNSGSDVIRNVTWDQVEFIDAQQDFIRVLCSTLATIERVYAYRCSFKGTKLGLAGIGGNYPQNAMRFISVAGGYASNYGTVAARFIGVIDCYAERIRTLADFKRGSGQLVIQGCRTKNMYDCHHSVDGAIGGVIVGNQCYVSPDFDATVHGGSNTNFIEVQGEDILVGGNVGHSDGARMINGILVTDYGYPEEGGVGHRSKGVKLKSNFVMGVGGNAYKLINPVSCEVEGNIAEDVTIGHLVAVDSGTGRTDGTNPLVAEACFVGGNVGRQVALGVTLKGRRHSYEPNFDENGQDYYYVPGGGLRAAVTYANINVLTGAPQINSNPLLVISGVGANNLVDFTNAEAAAVAATKPLSSARAVTLQDTSTSSNREVMQNAYIKADKDERVYFRLWVKAGTAPSCGVLIQERDSTGAFLASTFYGLSSPPAVWTEYVGVHKVANPSCAFVAYGLLPATGSNSTTNVGTTDFANLRVSKTMIGD